MVPKLFSRSSLKKKKTEQQKSWNEQQKSWNEWCKRNEDCRPFRRPWCKTDCDACRIMTSTDIDRASAILTKEDFNGCLPWTDFISVLLLGIRDPKSKLHPLRGTESIIIRKIYDFLVTTWQASVKLTMPSHVDGDWKAYGQWPDDNGCQIMRGKLPRKIAFASLEFIDFPKPKGRNVNMMPFTMGDINSLPEELQPYYFDELFSMIERKEIGKVCYLTVSEQYVELDQTQRRGGLHVEAPGCALFDDCDNRSCVQGRQMVWGAGSGFSAQSLEGGIYMASTLANTTEVYNSLIDRSCQTVTYHGGMSHLRPFIGKGTKLRANELVWITDQTPHEALPQEQPGYRQYFRLVTSNISVWFEEHSTPNPLVPLPAFVQVIKGNKFKETGNI